VFGPRVSWCILRQTRPTYAMGQLLHGCARTTETVRRAIQRSSDSIATLAERYHLNPKTVAKWKKRAFTCDAPMGPKRPRSRVLTREESGVQSL
jgi:hypothetical protein